MTDRYVTVFGASWCIEGDDLYLESEKLGGEIARHGFHVANGGYSGTMEGSAKGAAAVNSASIREGHLVPSLFPGRSVEGNAYLTHRVDAASLLTRIDGLIARSRYFVVMKGTLGTLTELCSVANISMLTPPATRPLIICYRDPWEQLMKNIWASLRIGNMTLESLITFVDSAEEAVSLIMSRHAETSVFSTSSSSAAATVSS
jgi:uncharacterized protein (TIGR00725 family)